MKSDIDSRVIKCIEHVIQEERFKSEAIFLQHLSWPSAKLSEARKGKSNFRTIDIGNFLKEYPQFNGHWILTGIGEMFLNGEKNPTTSVSQNLNKANDHLLSMVNEMRNHMEKIEARLLALESDRTHYGIVADTSEHHHYSRRK